MTHRDLDAEEIEALEWCINMVEGHLLTAFNRERLPLAHSALAKLRQPQAAEDYQLPCDIRLPPNTLIGKGCSLKTLLSALKYREGKNCEFRPAQYRAGMLRAAEMCRAWNTAITDQIADSLCAEADRLLPSPTRDRE